MAGGRKRQKPTSKVPSRRAATGRRALKKKAEAQIDAFLRDVGIKDPAEFTDDGGTRHLQYGSTDVMAFVQEENGLLTFSVLADVMPLPSDSDLVVPLMRELLELNCFVCDRARFGILAGSVCAVATNAVESMKDDQYADYIHGVMTLADGASGELQKKYGGTTRKRPRGRNHANGGTRTSAVRTRP
jgi:hypothetical protein